MCEVVTAMAVTSAVISAGSAGYGAYRANQQGKLARAAARRNAQIAEMAAADAVHRGEIEAGRVRSQGVYDRAKLTALMLAQGIDGSGAGLQDLLRGMSINSETDAEVVRNNAARQAWGYRNQADTSMFEGEVAASRANDQMIGSILSGAGDLLTGVAAGTDAWGGRATSGLGTTDVPNSSRQLRGWRRNG